jgi:hypothetical protein
MWLLTPQLFKNSIDTQEMLRLNLHSLSLSELLEYGRKWSLSLKQLRMVIMTKNYSCLIIQWMGFKIILGSAF